MGTLLEMYEQKIKSFISEVNIKSQPFIEQLRNEEEVEKRINFIKKELTELDEKAVTNEHIKTALFNTLDSFFSSKLPQFYYPIKQEMISSDQYLDQLKNIINRFFNEICSEIKRLDYLTLLKGKNIIIVGGNGVGKSTFASYLKQSASENIIIIPAQKYLYVYTKSGNSNLTISIPEVKRSLNNDIGLLGRTDENMYNFDRENSQVFTKSITAIVNDHLSQLDKDNSREVITRTKTQLIELEEVWKTIFPDIVLQRDTDFRSLFVMQNGFEYSVNAMSEGEKSVLFYLLQILFAPENSYVVIDEPETYLNPVISNRLWNKLESIRSDVKFVYISHSINFIASRQEANLIWIKNFTHPDNWNFQELETLHNQLPRELISELTGTKKPVIFIEGTYSSPDYSLFSSLFKKDADVFPVGGHRNVIEYTRVYNESPEFQNGKAFGIIDRDLMDEPAIKMNKGNNIYPLPFNEIEMMFFDEDLIRKYLKDLGDESEEISQKICDFKSKLIDELNKNMPTITQQKSKKVLDTFLANERIESYRNTKPEEMITEIKSKLDNLNLNQKIQDFETELKEAIKSENYNKLLELCPLKKQISKHLANQCLDKDFMERMARRIRNKESYIEILRKKYFHEINSEVLR